MLSALIKLTTPANNSDSFSRLSRLLLTRKSDKASSVQSLFSIVDNEFEIHLDATFDDSGAVTDIYLKD